MKNTSKEFQSMIQAILPEITSFVEDSQSGKTKVLHQDKASNLAKKLNLLKWIKEGGIHNENVNEFLHTYLQNSQRMHHPQYIGHQVSSSHLASGIADFIHGATNNPMAIYEMGPSASVIEKVIINWMLDKAGWFRGSDWADFDSYEKNGGGLFTHGGSLANLTALSAARSSADPDAWVEGNNPNLVVLASDCAHYSVARSISIMGMGKKALIPVPTDKNEVIRPETMDAIYKQLKNDGKTIMCCIANACATSTGLYDPVDELGDFCNEHNIWYHVDGAHGASALLSPKEKHLLKGLDKADSLIWDTHKMLRTTTLSAAVLFKDGKQLDKTFQQKGSYLFHDKEKPGFDVMAHTVECTKAPLATKLFWVLAAEGEEGITDYIDRQYDITKKFHTIIDGHEDFECPYIPESNIICFRYKSGPTDNAWQLNLRNEIISRGNFYITSTEIKGVRFLRLTVINALTAEEHIEGLLEEICEITKDL